MSTINGKACVANGRPVDKVFSDGRQVYGRNLLVDGDFRKSPSLWISNGAYLDNSGTFAKITSLGTLNNRIYSKTTVFDKIPVGSSFSISFLAYSETASTIVSLGSLNNLESFSLSTTPNKYKALVTKANSDSNACSIVVPKINDVVYIRKVKINLGSIATWTPAPEDVMQSRKENNHE